MMKQAKFKTGHHDDEISATGKVIKWKKITIFAMHCPGVGMVYKYV